MQKTYRDVFLTPEGVAMNQEGVIFDGTAKTRNRKVCGVGINDFPSSIGKIVDGKNLRWVPYVIWQNVLKRVHGEDVHRKYPTYKETSIDKNWLYFTGFLDWLLNQPFNCERWQLDKDVIGDGKHYGVDTCILIPPSVNSFIVHSKTRGEDLPIGASYHSPTGKYIAGITDTNGRGRKHLGLFDCPNDAHLAWKTAKLSAALLHKADWDAIDPRIYPGIVRYIETAESNRKEVRIRMKIMLREYEDQKAKEEAKPARKARTKKKANVAGNPLM